MAAIQPEYKDQQSAAGLTLNLSSNNPFRNRAASPALHSPVSPFDDPVAPPRPISRNPFLDPALANRSSTQNIRAASETMSTQDKTSSSPTADDLFGALSIEDKQSPALIPIALDGARPPPNRRGPPPGRENMPPPGRRGPPPNHRPTRSQEEALRARRRQANGESATGGPSDTPRSPQKRERRRRNSESSVVDDRDKPLTEEEKKARDARRRERERRHQENKAKKPVNRKLDIIDQLDATSIYGTGMFHHDGPFDALNPHRNKGNSRRAPMQAFPKDSLNNVIGGSGPLNSRPDHAAIMGRHDDEAFKEWSTGAAKEREARKAEIPPVFDPLGRGSILHGDESLGLGTSTFLEGTPAARTAIQKREEERAAETFNEGLQRKKSLAQRIRNINRGPRDFQSGRMTNPEGAYTSRRTPSDGGQSYDRNPFFADVDSSKRPTEETISVRRPDSNGDKISPTSPRAGYGLERRATTDATAALEDGYSKPSGILGRMKSLKGGRRTRPAPPNGENITVAAPGTAV